MIKTVAQQESFDEYDIWNEKKKELSSRPSFRELFCHEREIWWCSLGKNIGSEENGKHELFERPVIVFRKFGKNVLWAIPLTTRLKLAQSRDFYEFTFNGISQYAHLSQMKPISVKRLLRCVGNISSDDFQAIRKRIAELI